MEKSGCMNNCIDLIEGTMIGIALSGGDDILQKVVYNGYKRKPSGYRP